VQGRFVKPEVRWTANAFSFAGFSLSQESPPTFGTFFAPSEAHSDRRFYRLVGGKWRLVTDPGTAPMRDAEAYCIYSRGRSDYQGPVQLDTEFTDRLAFGPKRQLTLTFRNASAGPQTLTIRRPAEGRLPLYIRQEEVVDGRVKDAYPPLPDEWSLPEMQAEEIATPTLVLRPEELGGSQGEEVLVAVTPGGMVFRIPLTVD
jgi:hypothetical protein